MTKNDIPEVRVSVATGLVWEFVVPSSATTCSEQAEEIVQFCEQVFYAFGDFFTPLEINYEIDVYGQNTSLRPDSDSNLVVTRQLQNNAGIRASEFVESASIDHSGVRWIPRVPFDKNRFKIHFNGTDYNVERSDCTPYHKGEPRPGSNIPDPLDISVHHRPASDRTAVTEDHLLAVLISMNSDLWLQSSETGQRNRAYLVEFFEDIADAVSATMIQRDKYATSDFWNDLSVYSSDDEYIELEPEAIY